jgi:hypothetical protein
VLNRLRAGERFFFIEFFLVRRVAMVMLFAVAKFERWRLFAAIHGNV